MAASVALGKPFDSKKPSGATLALRPQLPNGAGPGNAAAVLTLQRPGLDGKESCELSITLSPGRGLFSFLMEEEWYEFCFSMLKTLLGPFWLSALFEHCVILSHAPPTSQRT